ncbi:hypothetical protein B5C34_03600 [Pacificimonas flava]|uniref:Tyr recombinase domain-containing protein n=2 Tax=Pacificimonas TaxID=1960290 RepID=A0A219B376_9SPHN|nr:MULTISPECIES: DUF6538 domain-containing protein [Pacificimonas]MBZ6377696.1 tyrosine-type recombinase/integrase [Pacificimonas aurantium]OWV32624.1 hypothetical protein B5C34_03600 [Pacificimonas flava]
MCTYLQRHNGVYRFRRSVPSELRPFIRTQSGSARREWVISLGTKDREEAKRRLPEHTVETDRLIDEARARAVAPISEGGSRESEERAAQEMLERERQLRHEKRKELRTGLRMRMALSTAELTPEEAAHRDLLRERDADISALKAAIEAQSAIIEKLKASSGYGSIVEAPHASAALSIRSLFEEYAVAAKPRPQTVKSFRAYVETFCEFIGHDDARRISSLHVRSWLKKLENEGGRGRRALSPKTVRESYLPALAQALQQAVADGRLEKNPAKDLALPRVRKPVQVREREFRPEETTALLGASLKMGDPDPADHTSFARRWVPWLCAYTGARVSEMLQLRKEDVMTEGTVAALHITPAAGSTKTDKPRKVPIHEHLLAQGFLEAVAKADEGPLFFSSSRSLNSRPS